MLITIGKILLKNRYFKNEFENLVVRYFQPMLAVNNKLLNSLMCNLLSQYLPLGDLSSGTVSGLM